MDQKDIGKKFKLLREKRGLTQEEVESAIGLPNKAVTHIESGIRKISTLELVKFSDLFLVPISDFFSQDDSEENLLVSLNRLAPGLASDIKIKDEISKCIHICREGGFLKNILGFSGQKTIRNYSCSHPKDFQEAKKQGEDIAREERRFLELGEGPIYDIADIISSQGIWIAETALPNQMSGLFLHYSLIGMAIIVNETHAKVRLRFSYAHEYAHALLDSARTITISEANKSSDLIEVRANFFASAFLMPEQGIAKLLRTMGKGESSRQELAIYDGSNDHVILEQYRQTAASQRISAQTIARIAHHFDVSYQAVVYRLLNLGYFKTKEADNLLLDETKGKEYLRVLNLIPDFEIPAQPKQKNRELKAQIAELAVEAFQREMISRGRLLDLSKLLGLSGKELLQLAQNGKIA